MKILFVANRVPYPPFRGDKLKIYNLAKQLKADHELHLITIAESHEDLTFKTQLEEVFDEVTILYLPKWKSIWNTFLGIFSSLPLQVAYFKFPAFATALDDLLLFNEYDAIHVQHLRMSRFFIHRSKDKVVLDLPDAFSLYWKRRYENARSMLSKAFAAFEYRRLMRYEKKVLPLFQLNLVCSDEDKLYLEQLTRANLKVLPNGVDTDVFVHKPEIEVIPNRILFTGNMDYEPNIDAAEYFVAEIFPEILKQHPNAEFVIAGQRPVKRVLKLASNNIIVTGFVEDISQEYAKAYVVVAPLRIGAGTQNKVLEAMAVGTPVVCTKVGFKGIGVDSGQGAVLANDKDKFAEEVCHILGNKEYRHRISFAGKDIIQSKFGWHAVAQLLQKYLSRNTA